MYTQTLFERSLLTSTPLPPSPNKFLSSPLLSHTCAHLRPHPLSFDIHPQNTRGWGIPISAKNFVPSPINPLSPSFSSFALRPLPPMLPLFPSPLSATLARHPCAKSFRCHSYAKTPEGGLTNCSTNPSQNGAKLQRFSAPVAGHWSPSHEARSTPHLLYILHLQKTGGGPPGLTNWSTNPSRNGTGSEIPLTSGSKHFLHEGCADKSPGENS